MIIKSLALNDFRNIENMNIEFDKGLNIIYGDNAQGKTNILESIYVAGTTRSHKGSKDKEMIRESVRLNEEIVKKGYDIVIIARGNIKDKKYADVESAYIHLCKLHHLLNEKRDDKN